MYEDDGIDDMMKISKKKIKREVDEKLVKIKHQDTF